MRSAAIIAVVLSVGICCHAYGGTMQASNGIDETGVVVAAPVYVGQTPRVDGKISERIWESVPKLGDFKVVGTNAPATQSTDVRVCYDQNTLYFAFECFDDEMESVKAQYTLDGEPVWQDDSIEIYISPNAVADAGSCHHFTVNVAGAKTYVQSGWEPRAENWRAAVSKMSDRWVAEVSIPMDMLRPLGKNEAFWRLNLCRNEIRLNELSSWSYVPSKYATYSRFGMLTPQNGQHSFCTFRGDQVLLQSGDSAPSGLQPVLTKPPANSRLTIVPEPLQLMSHRSKAPFQVTSETRIIVNDDAQDEDLWAADEINRTIEGLGGKPLNVIRSTIVGSDPEHVKDVIVIGETARNQLLNAICRHDMLYLPRTEQGMGAYAMSVRERHVVISGSSVVDTYYGVQTFKQLLRSESDGSIIALPVTVRDAARFNFRGLHLLASKDTLSYIGRLIDKVLAPLKINQIVLQIDNIDWASHPEIVNRTRCVPREDIKKLLEIARRHHINVTPLVQCPGHLEYALQAPQNRHLAEDPDCPYCYCMSNPQSYEFIYSLIDETIELFNHPEYVHMGHDEFDMRGVIPYDDQCKAVGKQRLYVQHINKIYDYLKSKDCKMMIWGDILSKTEYRDLLADVPKDILINDWRYSAAMEFPSVDLYQSQGFSLVGCTWYDPRNIETFAKYAAKRNIQGMLHTTWTGWSGESDSLRYQPHQLYSYILGAAWAWNPSKPSLDNLPYRPDVVFKDMYGLNGRNKPVFHTVRLDSHCNISRVDSARALGWMGFGHGNDLRRLREGINWMEDTPYLVLPGAANYPSIVMLGGRASKQFPTRVDGIAINSRLSHINFLHGCARSAEYESKVGGYTVHYEDGQIEQISLAYGREICGWNDQANSLAYGIAWRDKSQDGKIIGISELRWENPRPEVKVTSIDFIAEHPEASPFLVAMTIEE